MRYADVRPISRAAIARVLLLGAAVMAALFAMPLAAQAQGHLAVTFSSAATITTPGGADFDNGNSQTITVTANVTLCSHTPCVISVRTSAASVTKPASAVTSLDYCVANCAVAASWNPVPQATGNSPGATIASVGSASGGGTFQLRYRLGWASTQSSFTPAGSYTLPIEVVLSN
jgi:hypothetical protein